MLNLSTEYSSSKEYDRSDCIYFYLRFRWVHNQKENCHYDHILFNLNTFSIDLTPNENLVGAKSIEKVFKLTVFSMFMNPTETHPNQKENCHYDVTTVTFQFEVDQKINSLIVQWKSDGSSSFMCPLC